MYAEESVACGPGDDTFDTLTPSPPIKRSHAIKDLIHEVAPLSTSFIDLSEELLLEIFHWVPSLDLARVSRVSRQWYRVSHDQHLWRQRCQLDLVRVNTSALLPPPRWKAWEHVWQWFYLSRTVRFPNEVIKDGVGTFEWSNGAKYEGEWREDKEDGFGFKKWKDGATFDGEWVAGQFHGVGEHTWASGSTYSGQWGNHKRNGWGANVWPHRDRYEGMWKDDQKHGFGTYVWSDGRLYRGVWKDDKRCGVGCFAWPKSGYGYDGEWKDDKRHGHGRFIWNDGDSYEGTWDEGKRKGKGTFFCRNGCIMNQEWDEADFDSNNKGLEGVRRCYDECGRDIVEPTNITLYKRKLACSLKGNMQIESERSPELKRRKLSYIATL